MENFEAEQLVVVETEQVEEWEAEASRLLDELASQLDGLVRQGYFTPKEAAFWLRCCEGNQPEWTQEVIDSLPKYESSGEEVREEIDEILKNPVFSSADRSIWQSYADDAGYFEKLALKGRLETIRDQREAERKAMAQGKPNNTETIIDKFRTAIRAERIEEADGWLQTLDPKQCELVYRRLEQDLAAAKADRAMQQYDQAVRAA